MIGSFSLAHIVVLALVVAMWSAMAASAVFLLRKR